MRRWAFVFRFLNQNKSYAPVIAEALARGDEVEIWTDAQDLSGTTKRYEFPEPTEFPKYHPVRSPEFYSFQGREELERLAHERPVEGIFSPIPLSIHGSSKRKVFLIVTAFYDPMVTLSLEEILSFDQLFFASPYWIEQSIRYLEITHGLETGSEAEFRLRKKCSAPGSPQHDQLDQLTRAGAREALGIPTDRPVIAVFGFETSATFWSERIFHESSRLKRVWNVLWLPMSYPYFWSRLGFKRLGTVLYLSLRDRLHFLREAFRAPSEAEILRGLRGFCDREGAMLVGKFRPKNPIAQAYHESCDELVSDDRASVFPYRAAQVIAAADLVVSFYSTSISEAAHRGIPSINLAPDRNGDFLDQQYLFLRPGDWRAWSRAEGLSYSEEEGGLYRAKDLVWYLKTREFDRMIRSARLADFRIDPAAQERYRRKHTCPEAGASAARLIAQADAELRVSTS